MANDVETKIVEAQFRSEDFDKNIRRSTKNVEDFKKSLDFDDAVRQMRDVVDQGTPMSTMFEKLSGNVEKLANELTGIGNLSTYIAKKIKSAWQGALNSMEGFVKSLTTAQINEGSDKYNKLLKSVQTIKNATGDTEDYVYQVMSNLNKYTDETSYNFSDMAANIGKFTTAGVGLNDAEKEMEGIANWAALAGQGVNEAQRAMYNISQAMSAGYMKLMDYRSIQNANMDIRRFREEALKAAVAVGALTEKNGKYYAKKKKMAAQDTTSTTTKKNSSKKKQDANSGMVEVNIDNFTDTLSYGWFNREAMEKVFKVFADNTQGIGEEAYKAAQRCVTFSDALQAIKDMLSTGWMQSYQSIFGKLSDAMNLFSGMCNKASEMLSKFVETRNKILDHWSLTGRDSLWGALVGEIEAPDGDVLFKGAYGLLDALSDIGDTIYESFWNLVKRFADPAKTGIFESDDRYKFNYLAAGLTHLTHSVQDFTNSINTFLNTTPLGQTETRADQLRHTIEGIFAVVSMVFHVIKEVGRFGATILGQLQPTFDAIGYMIGYLAGLITGDSVKEIRKNNLGTFLQNLATVLRPVTAIINTVVLNLARLVKAIADVGSQTGITQKLIFALPFVKLLKNLSLFHVKLGLIGKVLAVLSFAKVANEIGRFAKSTDMFKKITAKSSGTLGKFWSVIQNTFSSKNMKSIKTLFTKKLVAMFSSFPTVVETIKTKLGTFGESIVNVFSWLFETLIDPLIGTAKAEDFSAQLDTTLTRSLVPGGDNPSSRGESLLGRIREGFTAFFKPIKDWFANFFNQTIPNLLNSDGVKAIKNFFSGTTFMEVLINAVQLKKWMSMGKIGAGLVSLGKGFKWIGKGGKVFGKNLKNLNLAGIFKDMFNISNIIGSNNTDNSKRTSVQLGKFGSQLLQIAAAVGVLVFAANKLLEMDAKNPDALKNAGIALAGLLGGLIMAGVAAKYLTGGGTGLLAIAAGIAVLVQTLDWLFKMPAGEFEQAGWKLAALMLGLSTAMWLATGGVFGGTRKLKGVISFALGLTLLLIPIKELAKSEKEIDSGILRLEALILGVAAVSAVMGATKFSGFKGMIRFALAITILLIPIKQLAGMKFVEEALKGIGLLTLLFVEIGVLARTTNDKKITHLSGLVGAIAALTAIGWLIGKTMDWKQAAVGFIPILAMVFLLGKFLKDASELKTDQIKEITKIFKALAGMVIVIGIALTLMNIYQFDYGITLSFFGGIILMLVAVGGMLRLASKTDASAIGKMSLLMLALIAMIAVTAGALIDISHHNLDWTTILSFLGGLAALVAVLGVFLPVLGKLDAGSAVTGILVLGGAIVVIMGAISLMAKVLLGSVGSAFSELSAQLKLMSGMLQDFFSQMDLISQESTAHAIAIFEDLKKLISGLTGFSGYEADISSVESQLMYLGTGLTMFFLNDSTYPAPDQSNAIATLNKLIELGPKLSTISFGNLPSSLMYLGSGLLLFDTSTKGIAAETPALSMLTSLINTVENKTNALSGSLPRDLMYLGVGAKLFSNSTKGIVTDKPLVLGLLQNLFGMANDINTFSQLPLTTFTSQMSGLGGAMSLYAKGAKEVTGIGTEELPDATSAIEILKSICASIAGEDGTGAFVIPENLPDKTELGLFAGQLAALAMALADYANAANSFQGDSASKSIELLKLLGEMGGYLTPDNLSATSAFKVAGVSGNDANGNGPLGQFSLDVGALGEALASFAGLTSDKTFDAGMGALTHLETINKLVTSDALAFTNAFTKAGISGSGSAGDSTPLGMFALDITALGSALDSFSSLTENAIFNNGLGALDKLSDLNGKLTVQNLAFVSAFANAGASGTVLSNFGKDIGNLGSGLGSFAKNITMEDGSPADFNNAIKALNFLVALKARLPDPSGFVSWFTGQGEQFKNLGGELEIIGQALHDFSVKLSNIDDGNSNTGFDKNAVLDGVDALSKIIEAINGLNVLFGNTSSNYSWTLIQNRVEDLSHMLDEITHTTISDADTTVLDQIALFAGGLSEAFSKVSSIDAGAIAVFSDLMSGIANLALVDVTTDFQKPGESIAKGMAEGVTTNQSIIVQSVVDVVNAALDAVNGVEYHPMITPIIDLSNVSGDTLDDLFGGNYQLNLGDALNRAAAATSGSGPVEVIVQNQLSLSTLQSQVSALQSSIESLGTYISNIQFVLNTGELAGGVTDGVDRNLGRKTLYASRRN